MDSTIITLSPQEALLIQKDYLYFKLSTPRIGKAWKKTHPGCKGNDGAVGALLLLAAGEALGQSLFPPTPRGLHILRMVIGVLANYEGSLVVVTGVGASQRVQVASPSPHGADALQAQVAPSVDLDDPSEYT